MDQPLYIKDTDYLRSQTDVAAKVATLDAIIDNLYAQLAAMAAQEEPIQEFMLNDGQTILKTVYKTEAAVLKSIDLFTLQRNRLINDSRPRTVRMVDISNFNGKAY